MGTAARRAAAWRSGQRRSADGDVVNPLFDAAALWIDGRRRGADLWSGPLGGLAPRPRVRRRGLELLQLPLYFGFGLQIVLHLEGEEVGRNRSRECAVDFAIDHADERHSTPLDNDVNRRIGHESIWPEVAVAVDRACDAEPQVIVELRDG